MSLSADQKVNMSLDDVIKQNQGRKGQGRRRRNPNRGNQGNQGNNNRKQSAAALVKIAKSVGAASAKRNASLDKRRGLNQTGKASKADVNKAVSRAANGRRNQNNQPQTRILRRPRPNSALIKQAAGLKISFKPNELSKTTEKSVSQQIQAAIQRSPRFNNSPRGQQNRSVVLAGGRNNNNNNNRGNNNNNNNRGNNNRRQPPKSRVILTPR